LAVRVAEALDLEGLLAVELFLDRSGKLWVNELAPRTHNSGHHTIEANRTSQFEQHLRAVLDLPLGDPSALQPAAMLNLVGGPDAHGRPTYPGLGAALARPGVHVHLYGKSEVRPYRKLGHITVLGDDAEAVVKGALRQKTE
jgi:5-(carboxyamino)imidazole ribonucleotide synthase